MATWHAYAKLRMHTTYTIKSLRSQTKELGRQLRRYTSKVCPRYKTKQLPGEAAAAYRRQAAKKKKGTSTSKQAGKQKADPSTDPGFKKFNLKTYKVHALGDYADHIQRFGPIDCFSTQQVGSAICTFNCSNPCRWSNRANSNIGGSRGSTNEPTRFGSSNKLQGMKGGNATTGNTSTP